jgi:O6-methylguanine-DNA--protein-cysteine methyltransferase
MKDKYNAVYSLLQRIPKGKVITYNAIAKKLRLNPRQVGKILSMNSDPKRYPCYKVIRSDCKLGGYTINGVNDKFSIERKRAKLIADSIAFDGEKIRREYVLNKI